MKNKKVAKKRNKLWMLQLFACMLVMMCMVSWGNPVTARADDGGTAIDVDFVNDQNDVYGGSGSNGIGSRTIPAAGVGNPVSLAGLGSTGRTVPNTLTEQMAMHQVQSAP